MDGQPNTPLAVALASPAAVKVRDRAGWLALFAPNASIEDPVGAGAYVGRERIEAFWDVFIAPQRDITFVPRTDFVNRDHVVRHVTISTITAIADAPFEIPAIVEYRIRDGRVASLRAFWQPHLAVLWHAKRGARGIGALVRHGARTSSGLGIAAAMGFGAALRPKVSHRSGKRIAQQLADAIGTSREGWTALLEQARKIAVATGTGTATRVEDAWDALAGMPPMRVDEVIVAGDHLACVLAADERRLVVLARMEHGRIRSIDALQNA